MGTTTLRGPAAGPALVGVCTVAAAAAVLRASQALLTGTDPFWHWDMGRRILASGLPSQDPYSFLSGGQEWVLNQWGTELLIGLARAAGGPWLVAVLTALLVGGAMLVTGLIMWRRSPSLLTFATFGLVVAAGVTNWSLRGNLLTFLLLPLLLHELQRRSGPRPLVILGLLVVWANVHAAFLLGVALTLLHTIARRVVRPVGSASGHRPWQVIAAAILAGAITPYGPRFLLGVLELSTRGAGAAVITEWAPTPITRPFTLSFTVLVALVLLSLAVAARREDLPDAMLVVGGALFGISAMRNVAAGAIVVGVAGAPHVRRAYLDLRDRGAAEVTSLPSRLDRSLATAMVVIGVVVAVLLVPRTTALEAHVDGVPLDIIRGLDALDREARVVTVSRWAPAVSALTGDHVRTSIDGRLELFTDDQFAQLRQVESADPGWEEVLDDWCVTDVVVPEGNALALSLDHGRWRTNTTPNAPTVEPSAGWWTRSRPSHCPATPPSG